MKKGYGVTVSLIACFVIAGCAQQHVPPPYPQETVESAVVPQETGRIETVDGPEQPGSSSVSSPPGDSSSVDVSTLGPKAEPFSAGFVNDRISFYNTQFEILKKLDAGSDIVTMDPQQTRDLFNCSQDLRRLLDGYQGFHDKLFQGGVVAGDQFSYENMIALQRLDITFLNSSCATLLNDKESTGTDSGYTDNGGLQQFEKEVDDYFQTGAYGEIAHAWTQLPPYQHDRVDMKTALQYADALMLLDRPAESADVYQQVIDRAATSDEQITDPLMMRKHLADLYTAAGNFFEAEKQYELLMKEYEQVGSIESWARLQLSLLEQSMKGSPELTDYTDLLRSYLGYDPVKEGFTIVWKAEEFLQRYPYSPVSDNVDIIKAEGLVQADQWFASFMTQADGLVADKQFEQAIDLLQSAPADKLSPDNLALLQEKLDSLILAEAVDRETVKIEKMQELQRIWNEGTALAEAGDVDMAIEIFGQLIGTEYEGKAQGKIAELSLAASKIERRKAADLFVRSTKTDDLGARKQLLTESRRVLKDILVKYPDVEVADKVRGNIRQVEKKMMEIDPLLLPEIEQQERDQEMMQIPADDEIEIEGFDVETPAGPSVDTPKKAVLPVYTPQNIQ